MSKTEEKLRLWQEAEKLLLFICCFVTEGCEQRAKYAISEMSLELIK